MSKENKTFFDYVAIAFLNAVVALLTGILIWLGINGVPFVYAGLLPFQFVYWFVGIVVVIGFFVQDTWFVNLFGRVWNILYRWFNHL